MLISLILRLALVYTASVVAECCFQGSSSKVNSDGGTGATGSPLTSVSTSSPTSNRLQCTVAEQQTVDCHNGGTCFAVKNPASVTQRILSCACTSDWSGAQCENRNFMSGAAVQQAGTSTLPIVIGIVVFVAVVLVVVVAVVFIFRKGHTLCKGNDKTPPTCASVQKTQPTFASYAANKDLNTVDANSPLISGVVGTPEVNATLIYNYDQPVDGSNEKLADKDAFRRTPDVVPDVVYRSRSPAFNPITIQPFADRRSGLGDTSIQYSGSTYSRTSALSQIRQHETSM